MTVDLATASALELAAAIRRRDVSPTEVMEATLAAIAARNPALNAIVWLDEDDARRRAAEATERLASGAAEELPPFHGVPLPIKDLYHVAGWPSTYGSPGATDTPVTDTSPVIERLVGAGFVLCGRSNSPEFGTITATENDRYGITRNPWDLDRTPGGSSGGASAAVAGGMFTMAHASDGGGSIRIPATCTGLVGLKPARGRVVDATVSWEGASTQGVVSRTVADTAAALDVLAVPDPLAWWNAPPPSRPFSAEVGTDPQPLRVLASTDAPMGVEVDAECARAVEVTLAALADAGHQIVEGRYESHAEEFVANFGAVVNAGMSEYDLDWDEVQPYNQAARRQAAGVDSLTYTSAIAALQRWTRTVNAQWGRDFDLLVTPTMAVQPPRAGQMLREITDDPATTPASLIQTILFTSMFNMNGLPAISLPVHQARDTGLPIGVQLVAGPWQESLLLAVAAQVEQRLPWTDRHPDLDALTSR